MKTKSKPTGLKIEVELTAEEVQEIKSANAEANKRTRQGEEAYRAAREKYGDAIIESVLKS